jgi:L-erythro-3,5-diaminohexanoate dehydrogenase
VLAVTDPYGARRVLRPPGVLPQQAEALDAAAPLGDDELLIEVDALNIDAASFRQLRGECGDDPRRIGARVCEIVAARGKMQNPVTGSGGMLIGRVAQMGPSHPAAAAGVRVGDRIATLVSLTLTPLALDEVCAVDIARERVEVRGRAVLFASGPWARLPGDLEESLALRVLDVCGAPAWVARLAREGMTVLVVGAGKSGSLACAQAKAQVGARGRVLALDLRAPERLAAAGLCDGALSADATRALEVHAAVERATGGALCDLVVNCASVPGTEMATVLCTRAGGTALFFSMATSFTAAALGAEGVGKDALLVIGNGYAPGHADLALELVRKHEALRAIFAA